MTVKELIEKLQEFDGDLIATFNTFDVGLALAQQIEVEEYYNYCGANKDLTGTQVLVIS